MEKAGLGLKDIKKLNKSIVLKTIWESGGISRIELSEKTNLSPATITSICDEFLKNNLIFESSVGESTGGRKPVILMLNPESGYICTIDITSEHIDYRIFNINMEQLEEIKTNISSEVVIQRLFENIVYNLDLLMDKLKIKTGNLIGIGITNDENIYINKKVLFDTGVSMGKISLDEALSYKYKTNVMFNDTNDAIAVAEYRFGTAENLGKYIFININDDIRISIINNGEILRNPIIDKNEMGHMIIDRNGPRCTCGRKGCLQSIASVSAVIKRVMVGVIENRTALNSKTIDHDMKKINFEFLVKLSNQGDAFIKEIMNDVADAICVAILNFSSLLNIKNVVVSGGMRKIKCFGDSVKEASQNNKLEENNGITVTISENYDLSPNKGNCALVISRYFNNAFIK